jgi:hypothetical protein
MLWRWVRLLVVIQHDTGLLVWLWDYGGPCVALRLLCTKHAHMLHNNVSLGIDGTGCSNYSACNCASAGRFACVTAG